MAQNFSPKTVPNDPKTNQNGSKQLTTAQNDRKREKQPMFFENTSCRDGGVVAVAAAAASAAAAAAAATAAAAVAAAGPKEPSSIVSIFRLVPSTLFPSRSPSIVMGYHRI